MARLPHSKKQNSFPNGMRVFFLASHLKKRKKKREEIVTVTHAAVVIFRRKKVANLIRGWQHIQCVSWSDKNRNMIHPNYFFFSTSIER